MVDLFCQGHGNLALQAILAGFIPADTGHIPGIPTTVVGSVPPVDMEQRKNKLQQVLSRFDRNVKELETCRQLQCNGKCADMRWGRHPGVQLYEGNAWLQKHGCQPPEPHQWRRRATGV